MTEKELEQQSEEFKKGFSVGYQDGKQNERKLQLGKTNLLRDVEQLEEENEKLKKQIEIMKKQIKIMRNCENCRFAYDDNHDCMLCDDMKDWEMIE